MSFEKELQFLKENKESVISKWSSHLNMMNNNLDYTSLFTDGNLYFEFQTDIHIPAEFHPLINLIPEWCENNYRKEITFSFVLTSCEIWRNTIIDIFLDYANPKKAMEFLKIIYKRQDVFLREYYGDHMKKPLNLIKEKDVKINKLHTDRINLIGEMAASMAHEIRNPLTSISGFLKLIRNSIVNGSQIKLLKYIDVIDDEFDAINMQITGFLSFSKNNILEENFIEISLMQLINSTLFLLNPRLISENIDCVFKEGNNSVSLVYVQKISIQQVISNIVSNAIDALISVNSKREITISCHEDELFTYIQITNNGPEISEEIRDYLFEPFMTNKEKGTGLGLAICREIMTKNNGKIDFISNKEETSFILSFSKQRLLF